MKYRLKSVTDYISTSYYPQVRILFMWFTIYLDGKIMLQKHNGWTKEIATNIIKLHKGINAKKQISYEVQL